jgi:hypothetical protein
MTEFKLNGTVTELPFSPSGTIQDLINRFRNLLNTEASLISSFVINGVELTDADEAALGPLPADDIRSIQISTMHPREIAEDTLQSLIIFAEHLEQMSIESADTLSGLSRVVDGVQTFSEAVVQVKRTLRIGALQKISLLEADLLSIMRDLADAAEAGQSEFVAQLLREHLPANFRQWRDEGIPALIRSRDS